ncbi:cytochrome-c peroxidase [Sediminibacterium soli]|uniref:cytochrome-c peroxidase n=1 Tax=Sediminibacterium soli TaxID=2698829 RepID=UPI00137A7CFC|nr:cytochrome-c peroxidase [Sediminibacterium soli]NCI45565.1 cytochrome-c peroxidase [Sediminibacterium soli]
MNLPKTITVLGAIVLTGIGWMVADNRYFKPRPVAFTVPKGWPQPVYDFSKNPLTEEGIALGKKLFYDTRFSKDNTFSCGSCHQQFGAFNTYDHNLSHGINNSLTTRNAPGLFNLAWQKAFMWDGGINHLDLQPLAPITAENEMGESVEAVIGKLRADKTYPSLFKAAFGDATISYLRIGKALSQFMLQLVSSNSKYDRVMRGEASFILPERLGYEIFRQKCTGCHTEPLFTDFSYRNTGMAADRMLNDAGRMKITGSSGDSLKFRVPSLRNVAMTFPYGHDGRFFSLLGVFEHYRKNLVPDNNTDPLLKNGLPLSNYEIGQLTAFLYTLTDSSFLNDPRFAPPGYGNGKPPVDIHR